MTRQRMASQYVDQVPEQVVWDNKTLRGTFWVSCDCRLRVAADLQDMERGYYITLSADQWSPPLKRTNTGPVFRLDACSGTGHVNLVFGMDPR